MKCGPRTDGQCRHHPEFVTEAASTSGSQSVVPAPRVSLPGDVLEMQVLWTVECGNQMMGLGPVVCVLTGSPGGVRLENHCSMS